jgi:hypothetical protein
MYLHVACSTWIIKLTSMIIFHVVLCGWWLVSWGLCRLSSNTDTFDHNSYRRSKIGKQRQPAEPSIGNKHLKYAVRGRHSMYCRSKVESGHVNQ